MAFTADEEAGGDSNGPAFLLKEHRDLIDAALVVNLDGGGGDTKNGERQFFEVGTSEKTYVTFTLETTSPGGHGSLPGPDNAIYRLASGLGRLRGLQVPGDADRNHSRKLRPTRGSLESGCDRPRTCTRSPSRRPISPRRSA